MFESLTVILIFLAVIFIGSLIFGGWLIVAVARLIGRAFVKAGRRGERGGASLPHTIRCTHARCRAVNPERARFCRRCGKMFAAEETPVVRRVAMW